MKQQNSDPAVGFEIVPGSIPSSPWNRGPFHKIECIDVSGEHQVVDHLVALAINLGIDAVDEGALHR